MLRLPLLALLIGLLGPMHTRLARSEPSSGAIVGETPRELRLWFEGGVEAAFTRVSLHGANGARFALGAPRSGTEDGLVLVPVPLALSAGRYTVGWETVGRDGHAVRGEFAFTVSGRDTVQPLPGPATIDSAAWGAGSAGRTVVGREVIAGADSTGASTRSPAQFAPWARPIRWLELSALTAALGAVALLVLVLRTATGSAAHERFIAAAAHRVRRLGIAASIAFLLASAARFLTESYALHGGSDGWSATGLVRTASIAWGRAWALTFLAMVVVLVTLAARRARRDVADASGAAGEPTPASPPHPRGGHDMLLGLAALVAAVGPATTGHAAGAAALMPLAVLVDWLHVIGAACWIGGLAAMALAAAPAALAQPAGGRTAALAWLIAAFHALALPAIVLVTASGLGSAWLRVGSWQALMSTNYGDLLLFKLYLVGLAALLGAYHWHRVRPRLARAAGDDERPAVRLAWTLKLEVLVGFVIIGLTAALVTTPPPR